MSEGSRASTADGERIRVIDSHTEGEPTRVVVGGGPDLGDGSAAQRLLRLRDHHDEFRAALVNEPRGYDALVGALLLPPESPRATAQVIFFNNVGYLGMCVHGTIGVIATLAWTGGIEAGTHRLETPVGPVSATLEEDGSVAVENVESYRSATGVKVMTESHGEVIGDVAWGGNWFFLISDHGQRLEADNIRGLTDYCLEVRQGLAAAGVRGRDDAEVDHIELFGPPERDDADSRNFVLCPGGEYDRSPCGTGTSAKMACLWDDGELGPEQRWRQESIIGSRFTGWVRPGQRGVIPTVRGRAWVTGEGEIVRLDGDPFAGGIRR